MISEEGKIQDAIARFIHVTRGHPIIKDGIPTQVGMGTASEELQRALEDYIDYRVNEALEKFARRMTNRVERE